MPVRLNIMIDDDLHEFLKRELPAKGISRFINDAIRARLRLTRNALDEPDRAAETEGRGGRLRPASGRPPTSRGGRCKPSTALFRTTQVPTYTVNASAVPTERLYAP